VNLLANPEIVCLLAILMVVLTIKATGVLAMLFGGCAIMFIGVVWFWIITQDSDEDF